MSVLYVEDEIDIREPLARFIAKRVGALHTAGNGEEGWEMFQRFSPDIVVTDIQMPFMNGLDMARLIRNAAPEVPILITTAFSDSDMLLKSIEVGVDRYIKKPLRASQLMEQIENIAANIERKRELERKNRLIEAILDNSPGSILTFEKGKISYMNRALLNYLGFTSLEEFLKEHSTLDPFLVEKEGSFYKGVAMPDWVRLIMTLPDEEFIISLVGRHQLKLDAQSYIVRVSAVHDSPNICGYDDTIIVSLSNVTTLEMERRKFEEQAMKDPLTGIYNRKFFFQELDQEIARSGRFHDPFSVVMFDIDYFKRVNDTYGHQVGDSVLKEVVVLTQGVIRNCDIFGRYGGEEFVLLLPNTKREGATHLAEKLRRAIEQHEFDYIDKLTVSLGVTSFSEDQRDANALINSADTALYRAKNNGRNRVEYV
ncbi:GGDEF domain-containing response regulator [Chrysiogenes arsenatis]|uniref:GGDEF domain-containing response regulator n=1 Tax=Chrysiogenes arsenatis TaxID=309797 RepID=UPI00135F1B21|nr:diguanylate cyclase [Chrysiogenes arsenatis]